MNVYSPLGKSKSYYGVELSRSGDTQLPSAYSDLLRACEHAYYMLVRSGSSGIITGRERFRIE